MPGYYCHTHTYIYQEIKAKDFLAILSRGPTAFQIGKISAVNPKIGEFVIVRNYGIITHTEGEIRCNGSRM